jgi:ectoine hydroxylase-related dioxygenase (phytanoyl-CoA dioxygenase family)
MKNSSIVDYSIHESNLKSIFEENGYVLFNDLFTESQIKEIQLEFFDIVTFLSAKYGIDTDEKDLESIALHLFSKNPKFRKNLYGLFQELGSITALCGTSNLIYVFKKMGLKFPVFRNQAIRIDFAQEPQYLQGIHQDVRGMRSSNCLNFWIPLQKVNEDFGTLAVYPRSHLEGGIMPTLVNESGYQTFSEEEVAKYQKVNLDVDRGCTLMFHPYLFHGSVQAKTNRLRLTITLRFDDLSEMDWLDKDIPDFYQLDIQKK